MKIDRLIGILSILLQNQKVTAPELAERFEVSRRTINRDIEDICKAGIPLVTVQGANGGIYISEGYKIDNTLLTKQDKQAILTGLGSLDSISGSNRYKQLMGKLSYRENSVYTPENHTWINLSSYYKDSLSLKIDSIQKAIEHQKIMVFDYYCKSGESIRQIEPYLVVFQWTSWYVWGFSLKDEGYRLFKLNRLWNLQISEDHFKPREPAKFPEPIETCFPDTYHFAGLFDCDEKWRLIEEYGIACYTEQQDGRLHFEFDFANKEHMKSWVLSFGSHAEVLEPEELRIEIWEAANEMIKKYTGT